MTPTATSTKSTSAESATTLTLFHNPNCSKSRAALDLLTEIAESKQLQLQIHQYLLNPLSPAELTGLLSALNTHPTELVRKDKNFAARNLDESNYKTADEVIDLLIEYPDLMQRPIAVFRGRAMIGRPPNDLQELFT